MLMDPFHTPNFHNKQDCSATVKLSTIVTKGPVMGTPLKNQKYKKALGLRQKLAALISEGDITEFKEGFWFWKICLITGNATVMWK